ncbi:MAG TPA: exodeoxyribonuclease VII large subunit [Thermoplasmatales archaeon]|nr:exodeoxyribonuclease VII large subunit [Thermoplasmatales archaeon]
MLKRKIFTVSEISGYIKEIIEKEELTNIWVEGEISNFRQAIGHYYFDLKDEKAVIKCVMFSPSLPFTPKNGMKVIVKGDIRVYEKKGYYEIYVKDIKVGGVGELFIRFLELKEKLEKEGLFDEKHKKSLPKIPSTIGVVTSPNGAAIRDIQNIISRRFPVRILLAPVRVQGEGAAEEVARAIKILNMRNDVDLIIVARGGGSWEDLWAFNEEKVARAIFESKLPIITAIGHETDYTIADFVADRRAPTPSAAAELAVPERTKIEEGIEELARRMEAAMRRRIDEGKGRLETVMRRKTFMYPFELIYDKIAEYERLAEKLLKAVEERVKLLCQHLAMLERGIEAMSPYKVLERGYSICFRVRDNKIFSSVDDADVGEEIRVVVKDGEAICRMESKRKK